MTNDTGGKIATEFLGRCMHHAMASGVHTPQSFAKHFPALARARVPQYAKVAEFEDAVRVWSFLTSIPFWRVSKQRDRGTFSRAHALVKGAVEAALALELVSPRSLVLDVGVEVILEHFPRALLAKNIHNALTRGERGSAMTHAMLLGPEPVETLTLSVPLAIVWEQVIEPLAQRLGFTGNAPGGGVGTTNRRALDALLRTKTGTTMELDVSELELEEPDRPRTGATMQLRTSDILQGSIPPPKRPGRPSAAPKRASLRPRDPRAEVSEPPRRGPPPLPRSEKR